MSEPADYHEQSFLLLLDQLVHTGPYNVLVYMIQIILEGWGLHHYRSLAAHCQHPGLTEVLRNIVHDEAKHHGSGLVILPQETWTSEDTALCLPALKEFLHLVRLGPVNLIKATEKVVGPLSGDHLSRIYRELDADATVLRNLSILEGFILEHCPDPGLATQLKAEICPSH